MMNEIHGLTSKWTEWDLMDLNLLGILTGTNTCKLPLTVQASYSRENSHVRGS